MTAYSRVSSSCSLGSFIIEIQSVNRKILDFVLHLPKNLLRFEVEIRKLLSQALQRGQITLRLTFQDTDLNGAHKHFTKQLKALKKHWQTICHEIDMPSEKEITLKFLVDQLSDTSLIQDQEETEIRSALQEAIEKAVKKLSQMKLQEGELLSLDLQKRLQFIEESILPIEERKELPLEYYREKIQNKLKEITPELNERLEKEVILLAEKIDITEEIVRLRAHIGQFRHYLDLQELSVGKTLDFLTQEMHREINTLGSKSMDTEISKYVVKMKSELEKIREQVQNIE